MYLHRCRYIANLIKTAITRTGSGILIYVSKYNLRISYYFQLKATLKMFRPKEVKYIKRPKKFDIPLVYNNIEFIRDTFHLLHEINEGFK